MDGVATVLGVAADSRKVDGLREALTARAVQAGLRDPSVRVRRGEPAEQIAAEQRENPYDFVVLGAGEVESMRRRRRRSTALGEELARSVATPLLLARGRPRKPERILICTAVGEPGKADIRAGGWLARRLNATATLLHVSRPAARRRSGARASGARRGDVARAGGPEPLRHPRGGGSRRSGILAELRDIPGLVVIGGHGPAARSRSDTDDITRQVLRFARSPVLVVPENARRSYLVGYSARYDSA